MFEMGAFRDRVDAGSRLADRLEVFRAETPVVLGLPRGGVPVAAEVARRLEAPLDVIVARKIGAPGHPEFGIGAVTADGLWLDDATIEEFGLSRAAIDRVVAEERLEVARREREYRGSRPPPDVGGRTVILVDDGLATGVTARAAIASLRRCRPARIVFAAPVCAPESAASLEHVADRVVCLECPPAFQAVGLWYRDFTPTSDAEVQRLLDSSRHGR